MFVPGAREYLSEEDVAALRVGDTHCIESGLGGAFNVRFHGHEGERFIFRNVSKGWEDWSEYELTFDEVRQQVYEIVAAEPFFRQLQEQAYK